MRMRPSLTHVNSERERERERENDFLLVVETNLSSRRVLSGASCNYSTFLYERFSDNNETRRATLARWWLGDALIVKLQMTLYIDRLNLGVRIRGLLPSRTLAFENRGQEFRFDYWVSNLGGSTCTSMPREKIFSPRWTGFERLLNVDDICRNSARVSR